MTEIKLLNFIEVGDLVSLRDEFIHVSYDYKFRFIFSLNKKVENQEVRKYLRNFFVYTQRYCGDDYDEQVISFMSKGFLDD